MHHFVAIGEFKLELQSGNAQFGSKSTVFFSHVTLEFHRWLSKTIGHLFYVTSSFLHHFVAIGDFKLELQSGNAQFGSKSTFFLATWFDIWQMTFKNNRAPLLSIIKLCASFHCRMWIQTGITVRKRLSGVMTSVTLTLTFRMDITSVNGNNFWKFHDDTMSGT